MHICDLITSYITLYACCFQKKNLDGSQQFRPKNCISTNNIMDNKFAAQVNNDLPGIYQVANIKKAAIYFSVILGSLSL